MARLRIYKIERNCPIEDLFRLLSDNRIAKATDARDKCVALAGLTCGGYFPLSGPHNVARAEKCATPCTLQSYPSGWSN